MILRKNTKKNGFYIFLVGQKNHPETIGTISYCGKFATIIEQEEDIENAVNEFYNSKIKKLVIICQTTFSLEKFKDITKTIEEKIKKDIYLEIKNTICDATRKRQEETISISKNVDTMIIVGGKHSSNTNKLYKIAKDNCANSILVENEEDLDKELIKGDKIGIMAGASTPKKTIEKVVEFIKKL